MSTPLEPYLRFLRKRLDSSGGFLDYLVEKDVLSDEQRNTCNNLQNDYYKQNDEVLELLSQRLTYVSSDFENILEALKKSGQEHLEQHIRDRKGTSDIDIDLSQACSLFSPLSSFQINEISKLMGYLCNDHWLRCTEDLLFKLWKVKCLAKVHRDRLQALQVEADRSRMLVNLIKRGSVGALYKTVEVLDQLGQKEAAIKLKNINSAYTAPVHVSLHIDSKNGPKNGSSPSRNSENEDPRFPPPLPDREEASGGFSMKISDGRNIQSGSPYAVNQSFNSGESNACSATCDKAVVAFGSTASDFAPANAATDSVTLVSFSAVSTGDNSAENCDKCQINNYCTNGKGENLMTKKCICNGTSDRNGNNLLDLSSNKFEEEAMVASARAVNGPTRYTNINVSGTAVCANGTTNVKVFNFYGAHINRNRSRCSESSDDCEIITNSEKESSELSVQTGVMSDNVTNNYDLDEIEQRLVPELNEYYKAFLEAVKNGRDAAQLSRRNPQLVKLLLEVPRLIGIELGQSIVLNFYCQCVSSLKKLIELYESNVLQELITAFIMEFIQDKKEYEGLTVANVEIYESDLEDMKHWCERVSPNRPMQEQLFIDVLSESSSRIITTASSHCATVFSPLLGISDDYDIGSHTQPSPTNYEESFGEEIPMASSSLPISLSADMSSLSPCSSFSSSNECKYEKAECRDADMSEDLLGFAYKQWTSDNMQDKTWEIPLPAGLISCRDLLSNNKDLKIYGYLRKPIANMGKVVHDILQVKRSSKFVFVVLCDGCLYIYKSESATKYEKATTLYGFTNVLVLYPQKGTAWWTFKIVNGVEDSKSLTFSASSQQHLDSWVNSLREEIFKVNSKIFPEASRSTSGKDLTPLPLKQTMKAQVRDSIARNELEFGTSSLGPASIMQAETNLRAIPASRTDAGPTNRLPNDVMPNNAVPTWPRKPPVPIKPENVTSPSTHESFSLYLMGRLSTDLLSSTSFDSGDKKKDDCDYEDELFAGESFRAAYWFGSPEGAKKIIMQKHQEGIYLIRDGNENDFMTLMVCESEDNKKMVRIYKINRKDKFISIDPAKPFLSFTDLLQHYTQNSLPSRTTKLTRPYSHD